MIFIADLSPRVDTDPTRALAKEHSFDEATSRARCNVLGGVRWATDTIRADFGLGGDADRRGRSDSIGRRSWPEPARLGALLCRL